MKKFGIIAGTQLPAMSGLSLTHQTAVSTPYGDPSSPLSYGVLGDVEVVLLTRRGANSILIPHEINYQANIWALRDAGVEIIIATSLMQSFCDHWKENTLVIPDQLIDYTENRAASFVLQESEQEAIVQVDFLEPFDAALRERLLQTADFLQLPVVNGATVAVTQGPRTPTLAESKRYQQAGCQLLSMTTMPEAVLAKELKMAYACLAIVGIPAMGKLNQLPSEATALIEAAIQFR